MIPCIKENFCRFARILQVMYKSLYNLMQLIRPIKHKGDFFLICGYWFWNFLSSDNCGDSRWLVLQ